MIINAKTQRRKGKTSNEVEVWLVRIALRLDAAVCSDAVRRFFCGLPRGMIMTLSVVLSLVASFAWSADPSSLTAEQWKREAEAYLRAGEKRHAAEAYESAVRLEPVARVQLAPVLARLYAEMKTSDKALGWAKVVMERSPDPQAYLAGVYQSLGQAAQAQSILVRELGKTNAPPRTVSLSWQLADLQLQQGATNAALVTLEKAAQHVKGTPESAQAIKRLQKFKKSTALRNEQHE